MVSINSKGYAVILAATMLLSVCGSKNTKESPAKSTEHSLVSSPATDVYVPSSAAPAAKESASPVSVTKTASAPVVKSTSASHSVSQKAKVLSEAWSNIMRKDIKPEFFVKVINFADKIKTNPVDFSFILYQESEFNPKAKCGPYFGLIQMDKTAFDECVGRMMEYEQYCKENPKDKPDFYDYLDMRLKKGFKKPKNPDVITFEKYKALPREKQFKYSEYYLKYRIHQYKLNNKSIPDNQLYALIHKPAHCQKPVELQDRRSLLSAVKYGGSVDINGKAVLIKGVREISPKDFAAIMKLR